MKRHFPLSLAFIFAVVACDHRHEPSASQKAPRVPESISSPTAHEIDSTVGVRVIAGGLPVRDYTGAILSRSELGDPNSYFDKHRCVIALLHGWTERQLRNPLCSILIYGCAQRETDAQKSKKYRARLIGFDSKTEIATLVYHPEVTPADDSGYKIAHNTPAAASLHALRKLSAPSAISAGSVSTSGSAISSTFPGETSDDEPAESPLVLSGDLLCGFLSGGGPAPGKLVPPEFIPPSSDVPDLELTKVTFYRPKPNGHTIGMTVGLGAKDAGRKVWLNLSKLDGSGKVDLDSIRPPFESIAAVSSLPLTIPSHHGELPAPESDGVVVRYLLQLGWKQMESEEIPTVFSRPFVVSLSRKSGIYSVIAKGVPNESDFATPPASQSQAFPVDHLITDLVSIAGGRELLVRLDAAPYWRRFSMERKDWLPLPEGDLASCQLAGNLSNLFVLDTRQNQFRKYRLSDLSLLATAQASTILRDASWLCAPCNSDNAPLVVFSTVYHTAVAPDTLRPGNKIYDAPRSAALHTAAPGNSFFPGNPAYRAPQLTQQSAVPHYRLTGDGLSLLLDDAGPYSTNGQTYRGDLEGLADSYFGAPVELNSHATAICAGYIFHEGFFKYCDLALGKWTPVPEPPAFLFHARMGTPLPTTGGMQESFLPADPLTFQSSPIFAEGIRGNANVLPEQPTHLRFYGFSGSAPIAEEDIPLLSVGYAEKYVRYMAGISQPPDQHLCFDPYSRQLAFVSPDQKSILVQEVHLKPEAGKPHLLNWPESVIMPGSDFLFTPLTDEGCKVTAELLGTKLPTPVEAGAKDIKFRLAKNEIATLLQLNLKLSNSAGESTYTIPIVVRGNPAATVSTDLSLPASAQLYGAHVQSFATARANALGLDSSLYESPASVSSVLGPVNGHIILVTDAGQLDILSLETRKLVNSMKVPEKAKYYPLCGALYEYDLNAATLTRISIPNCVRGPSFPFPSQTKLLGIGGGTESKDPLTLFVEGHGNEQSSRLGDYILKTWDFDRTILVLDSESLRMGPWAQPQIWTQAPDPAAMRKALNAIYESPFPEHVVGSQDGTVLALPNHLVVIGKRNSFGAPFPPSGTRIMGPYQHHQAIGSITGLLAFSSDGASFANGIANDPNRGSLVQKPAGIHHISPCGRYEINPVDADHSSAAEFEIRTFEGKRPLFTLSRLVAGRMDQQGAPHHALQTRMLGNEGPLLVISEGRHVLQFVDFNIGQLVRELSPAAFHAISQASPYVYAGDQYDYQIRVNNPDAVATYTLAKDVPNAWVSPEGLVHFTPPQTVDSPLHVNLSIEIKGKDGTPVNHEIPLLVVPRPQPSTPDAKDSPPTKL